MRIFHPSSPAAFAARNRLLQAALRPMKTPFPIAREYPLVLAPDAGRYSYCVANGDRLVAHANLWPRRLVDREHGDELAIGLVGNVATDESCRGQGIMSHLLTKLKAEAERQELKALVLWSDLTGFYQKQGFASCGLEQRFLFIHAPHGTGDHGFQRESAAQITPRDLEQMGALRPYVARTLARSPAEFRLLLEIPALDILTRRDPKTREIDAFALVGKGADMVGVVHEWGAETAAVILQAVQAASHATAMSEILLLAPEELPSAAQVVLTAHANDLSQHAMALAWTDDETRRMLAASFIWGLDSI